jgi:hypothetical protein
LRYSLNEHTDTDEWSFRACRIGRIIMPRNHTAQRERAVKVQEEKSSA